VGRAVGRVKGIAEKSKYAREVGKLGLNPPFNLKFYKNFITCEKWILFAYFLLVNLST